MHNHEEAERKPNQLESIGASIGSLAHLQIGAGEDELERLNRVGFQREAEAARSAPTADAEHRSRFIRRDRSKGSLTPRKASTPHTSDAT